MGEFFIVLCLMIMCLINSKIYIYKMNEQYNSKEQFDSLKGIFSLVILLHHINEKLESQGLLQLFSGLGVLGVAVFFFISGYGISLKTDKNKEYLNGFLSKRLVKIIIPYMIITGIYAIYDIIVEQMTISDLLFNFIHGDPIVTYSWYIFAIMYFYIAFYFSCKISRNKKNVKLAYLIIFWFIYIFVVYYVFRFNVWWINTAHCFIFGVFWADNKEKIFKLFCKYYYRLGFLFILLYGLITFLIQIFSKDTTCFVIIKSTIFVIIIMFLLLKVKFENKFLRFFSAISFNIYLFQGLIIRWIERIGFINSFKDIYIISVILFTVAASFGYNSMYKIILKLKKKELLYEKTR